MNTEILKRYGLDSGWQTMKTAPRDGTIILINRGEFYEIARWAIREHRGVWKVENGGIFNNPNRWMPLPDLASLPLNLSGVLRLAKAAYKYETAKTDVEIFKTKCILADLVRNLTPEERALIEGVSDD